MTTAKRFNRSLIGALLAVSTIWMAGCDYFPESTFQLAKESRLPKWFTLQPGNKRSEVSLTMSYFITPWGPRAKFLLLDSSTSKTISQLTAKLKCEQFHMSPSQQESISGYPVDQAVNVDGIIEIIEHRKMEPIFYLTDDQAVWKRYSATGCR